MIVHNLQALCEIQDLYSWTNEKSILTGWFQCKDRGIKKEIFL